MKFTILGASGFIGSHLANYIRSQDIHLFVPAREYVFSKNENLGHLIYCIGLTADFRQKPMKTIKAHVCKLVEVLENSRFESFLYLSSTRIYAGNISGTEEADLYVNPNNFSDLYNISKLMGESACLSISNPKVRVVRLSNVVGNDFGSDNFLFSLIKQAVEESLIKLSVPMRATKDYVTISDVVQMIVQIAQHGNERIYNIASGMQITNEQLVNFIQQETNCAVDICGDDKMLVFPEISIEKLQNEFSYIPENILNSLSQFISDYK